MYIWFDWTGSVLWLGWRFSVVGDLSGLEIWVGNFVGLSWNGLVIWLDLARLGWRIGWLSIFYCDGLGWRLGQFGYWAGVLGWPELVFWLVWRFDYVVVDNWLGRRIV